jgi:hypothetical protein
MIRIEEPVKHLSRAVEAQHYKCNSFSKILDARQNRQCSDYATG